MVKIRLARFGAKKRPFYRIVATDSRQRRDGRFIEVLGFYDPICQPAVIHLKEDRYDHWRGVGAQQTDTVASLTRQLRRKAAAEPQA
jgi:small subunit ribosomal protein S16